MEKNITEEQGKDKARMNEEQQNKLLLLFFILKKLRATFKSEMYFALIKTPASKPELDKWAFIFSSTKKLPFGLDELHAMIDMLEAQLGDIPLKVEAKKVKYDGLERFAITFEVTVKLDDKTIPHGKEIGQALVKNVKQKVKLH